MNHEIFEALFDIVTFFNQPQQDRHLLQAARVQLDPAALPIVVRVGRHPGLSIGELADQIGRNHSSISRQVDKLMAAGWLEESERRDQRVRRLTLSPAGQRGLTQIKVAREAGHAGETRGVQRRRTGRASAGPTPVGQDFADQVV